jgi:hypothetical protein
MKTILASIIVLSIQAVVFAQSNVIPYERNCKYGLITDDNRIIVKPQYEYVDYFAGNYFITECYKNGKHYYGVLSNNGKRILPCKYDKVSTIDSHFNYINEDLPDNSPVVFIKVCGKEG